MLIESSSTVEADRRRLVGFVIAGAQKCGTSAIRLMLDQHDRVYVVAKTSRDYFIHSPLAFSPLSRWGYERRFHPSERDTCIGESSSGYLFYPHALAALRRYNPRLKIILALRNPVLRAFSHWNMNVAKGRELRTFAEAIAEEQTSSAGLRYRHYFSYVERGLYGRQIKRLLDLFPRQQVLIMRSEEMLADPQGTWDRLISFLDLQDRPLPARRKANVRAYASSLGAEEKKRLTSYFALDNALLARLTGYDYSAWVTPLDTPVVGLPNAQSHGLLKNAPSTTAELPG